MNRYEKDQVWICDLDKILWDYRFGLKFFDLPYYQQVRILELRDLGMNPDEVFDALTEPL